MRVACLALLGTLLGACAPRAADPPWPEASRTPEVEPSTEAEAASTPVRFWVAKGGLTAYDLDGKPVATLGTIGASRSTSRSGVKGGQPA